MYNYDLEKILGDQKLYQKTKVEIESIILKNLDVRNETASVHIEDGEFFDMTLGNLLTILILSRPFVEFNVKFKEEFIVDVSDIKVINNYFDIIISYFTETGYDIRECLLDVLSELAIVSSKVLGKYGATINLYDICKLMETNKKFKEIIEFKFKNLNKNLEFEEMNKILDKILCELVDILTTNENCFKNLMLSGSGINDRQLRETLVSIGPKPDDKGNIIPEPVDTSYIKGQTPFEFLIDAYGGRKALITNFKQVKDSGYLTRKLTLLCLDNIIQDVKDCGTKHTVNVEIPDEKTLRKLQYRKYVTEDGEIKTIVPSRDRGLIGSTIKMRSVIKCACEDGVCKTCYGDLYKYNFERNAGIVAVLLLTDPLTQMLLSAKHLLQARAKKIEWGDKFNRFFLVNKDQILLNSNSNIKIIIPEFMEDEESYDNNYKFDTFQVDDGEELHTIKVPVNLIINNEIIDVDSIYDSKAEGYVIDTKELLDTDILFHYIMENNELSASLLALTNLIETNHFIKEHSIDDTLNEFIRLLNESPIGIHFVHIEMILKEMCKIRDNKRSLFKDENVNPIEDVYRISEALVKNPCLAKSMVYQELHKQLSQMLMTFKKDKKSSIDELLL